MNAPFAEVAVALQLALVKIVRLATIESKTLDIYRPTV